MGHPLMSPSVYILTPRTSRSLRWRLINYVPTLEARVFERRLRSTLTPCCSHTQWNTYVTSSLNGSTSAVPFTDLVIGSTANGGHFVRVW